MAKVYRIRDWDEHYENNRTRDMKEMQWVPLSNRHDGDGYVQLVRGPRGGAMLGAFVACVQTASKCRPRGTLLRRGGLPHNPATLSDITRLPSIDFEEMLSLAISPDVGWMEIVDIPELNNIPQPPAVSPHLPAVCPHPTDEEGNGRNGRNGRNGKEGKPPSAGVVTGRFDACVLPPELETPEFRQAWSDWQAYRVQIRKPLKPMTLAQQLRDFSALGVQRSIEQIRQSIRNGWQGLFDPRPAGVAAPVVTNAFSNLPPEVK